MFGLQETVKNFALSQKILFKNAKFNAETFLVGTFKDQIEIFRTYNLCCQKFAIVGIL